MIEFLLNYKVCLCTCMFLFLVERESDFRARQQRHAAIEANAARLSAERGICLNELLIFVGTMFSGIAVLIVFFTDGFRNVYFFGGLCALFVCMCALTIKCLFDMNRRRRAYNDYLSTPEYLELRRFQENNKKQALREMYPYSPDEERAAL